MSWESQGCNSIDTKILRLGLRLGLRTRLRTRLGRRFLAKMVKARDKVRVKAVQMSIESPPWNLVELFVRVFEGFF